MNKIPFLLATTALLLPSVVLPASAQETNFNPPGTGQLCDSSQPLGLELPDGITARVAAYDPATGFPSRIEYIQNEVVIAPGSSVPYDSTIVAGYNTWWSISPVDQLRNNIEGYEDIFDQPRGTYTETTEIPVDGIFHVAEIPAGHVYPANEVFCPADPNDPAEASRITEPQFGTTADWQGGFTGTLTFEYIDPSPASDWTLTFDAQFEITQMWDGLYSTVNNGDGTYTYAVDNESWNGSLTSGNSVTITFNANDVTASLLPVEQLSFTVADKTVSDDWGSGFTGGVEFSYAGDLPVDEWYLSVDSDFTPTESWLAVIDDQTGDTTTFANETYNGRLEPGDSVNIGFNADGASSGNFSNASFFGVLDNPLGNTPPSGFLFD